MKIQDFAFHLWSIPAWLVIGYFVRPHWKSFDPAAKFVAGLIPGLILLSLVVLLLKAAVLAVV